MRLSIFSAGMLLAMVPAAFGQSAQTRSGTTADQVRQLQSKTELMQRRETPDFCVRV